MFPKAVIYGSRNDGHAKVVYDTLVEAGGWDCVGCIDDFEENKANILVKKLVVIGTVHELDGLIKQGIEAIFFGFGDSKARRDLLEDIREQYSIATPSLFH